MGSAARDKIEAESQLVPRDAEMISDIRLGALLDQRQHLALELAEVEDAIWRRRMTAEGSSVPADEVLRIKEACARMSWSYSWAVKHWRELGGFKDLDGGLKIRADVLTRHVLGNRPSSGKLACRTNRR